MRKSVVNQSELAFAAYIVGIGNGTITPPPEGVNVVADLSPLNVYAYQQVYGAVNPNPGQSNTVATVESPALIFRASKSDQIGYDSGVYELSISAQLETQIDDEQLPSGASDIHHARVEALRDCLENFSVISAAVNYPANQSRVPYFTLSSILFIDEQESLEDRTFITLISYEITACPADPLGDS